MNRSLPGGRSLRWTWPLLAAIALAAAIVSPAGASADATYSFVQTIPVPPASSFAGSGGGDGWAVAMTPSAVYNVFHHAPQLQVACHLQTDASACWAPKTITDANGHNFSISSQPGLSIDQASGHLFVYATRTFDATAGVVCIDTTQPAANPDPFCGFTALTVAGGAPANSGVSNGALVGSRWYAFNYVDGAPASGSQNALLCFDTATGAACAGQPFPVAVGGGNISVADPAFRVPAVSVIGKEVIVPVDAGGVERLACFDGTTNAACGGSWPAPAPAGNSQNFGAAFPILNAAGTSTGLCLPAPSIPCFDFTGAPVATPAALASVVAPDTPWNGPAFVVGPRVYVPNGSGDQVQCFDYSTGASCANFPKSLPESAFLYTVNPDPQRASCIWVNADTGASQIQNFDAFTGGACGQGPIRVLASSIIVPTSICTPTNYTSLQVVSPGRATYTSGSVAFRDGDGAPLPGIADRSVDGTGTVSLTGLNLSSPTGLPQFLITLTGAGAPSSVVIKLVWTGVDDPSCVRPGTVVIHQQRATRLTANPVIASVGPLAVFLAPTAKLEALSPTQPLGGKKVTFKAGSTVICTATTAANGTAGCTGVVPLLQSILVLGRYTVTFAGDSQYKPSSATGTLLQLGSLRMF